MKNDLYVAYHPVDGPVLHSLRESEEQVKARFDGWEYRPWKYMEEEGYVVKRLCFEEKVDVLEKALMAACERIADGPQEYHEARTVEDWYLHYLLIGAGEEGAEVK